MDTKMFAILIVALFVTVGFASNISATANDDLVVGKGYVEVTGETTINGTTVRELTIVARNETVEFDGGSRSYPIDGGDLTIDENAGSICTARAYSYTLYNVPQGGLTVQVNVDYTYDDDNNIYGGYARFNLNVPQGGSDSRNIYDRFGFDDSESGTLSTSFTAYPGQTYRFTISCVRDGHDSANDTGDIYT